MYGSFGSSSTCFFFLQTDNPYRVFVAIWPCDILTCRNEINNHQKDPSGFAKPDGVCEHSDTMTFHRL